MPGPQKMKSRETKKRTAKSVGDSEVKDVQLDIQPSGTQVNRADVWLYKLAVLYAVGWVGGLVLLIVVNYTYFCAPVRSALATWNIDSNMGPGAFSLASSLLSILFLLLSTWQASRAWKKAQLHMGDDMPPKPGKRPPLFLQVFRYFLSRRGPARKDIELIIDDLHEDIAEMKADGYDAITIKLVVTWRSIVSILPIVWTGIKDTIVAISPLAMILKKLGKGP